ncbi:hypothetical protein Tco_0639327 [Tanacetum coccineum]
MAIQTQSCNGSATSLFMAGLRNGSLTGQMLRNSGSSNQLARDPPHGRDALKIIDKLRIEKKKLEEQKDEEIRELKTQLQKKKEEAEVQFFREEFPPLRNTHSFYTSQQLCVTGRHLLLTIIRSQVQHSNLSVMTTLAMVRP